MTQAYCFSVTERSLSCSVNPCNRGGARHCRWTHTPGGTNRPSPIRRRQKNGFLERDGPQFAWFAQVYSLSSFVLSLTRFHWGMETWSSKAPEGLPVSLMPQCKPRGTPLQGCQLAEGKSGARLPSNTHTHRHHDRRRLADSTVTHTDTLAHRHTATPTHTLLS
jgi:hypothetical protein